MFDISSISKAVAGGIIAALVAVAARYGFHPTAETVTAGGVIITAVVGYVVAHVAVFLAPSNKPKL